MFKRSEQYKEILGLFKDYKILKETAYFICLSDGIMVYEVLQDELKFEICLISDDDFLEKWKFQNY